MNRLKLDIQRFAEGYVTIKIDADTKSFDEEIKQTEEYLNKLVSSYEKAGNMKGKFKPNEEAMANLRKEIEKTNNKLIELRDKQSRLNSAGFNDMKGTVEDVGKSVNKVTKRIAKMAIAVFGIRSAFMFVRNSINMIAQNDDQLSDDIQYIKIALAYTIEPIVRAIVNLAKQLMFYVGYIVKAWTGKNIFANASKGLDAANEKAKGLNKELNKTTASFDEMNTLSDNSSNKNDGIITPSFDLGDMENMEAPGWLKFIVDHKDEILAVLGGIAAGLIAVKLGLSGIQALGIGVAIAGIIYTVEKIIDFINDPSFDNFIGILEGIAIAVGGVAIAFEAWPVAIGAAVALVVIEVVKHFDEIMGLFNGFIKWIDKDFRNLMRKVFGPVGDIITNTIEIAVKFCRDVFENFYGGIKQIVDGIVKLFQGDFWGGLQEIFSGLFDLLTAPFQAMLGVVSNVWEQIKIGFSTVWDFVLNAFSQGGKIFNGLKEGVVNVFKAIVNTLIDGINKIIAVPFKTINKLLNSIRSAKIPVINVKPFKGLWDKNPLPVPKIPKLAKGAIASYPGSGIPTVGGGARWAEAGREAYLPLTDAQVMSSLGEAIGRNVTIPVTVINKMNGRTIDRVLQVVKSESDFAYNR